MKIKLKKKKYSSGGQIAKDIGAGAYGLGEGLIDNLTSVIPGVGGLVDTGTDKLFNMLNKNNKEAAKVRAVGDVVGNVGGAILTGGATTLGAVTNGIGATNDFIQNTNMSDKGKQLTGIASGLATTVAGLTGTGKVDGINGLGDIGKMIKYKKGGGVPPKGIPPEKNQFLKVLDYVENNYLSAPQKAMMFTRGLQDGSTYVDENGLKSIDEIKNSLIQNYEKPSSYVKRKVDLPDNAWVYTALEGLDMVADPVNLAGGAGIEMNLARRGVQALNIGSDVYDAARIARSVGKVATTVGKGVKNTSEVGDIINSVHQGYRQYASDENLTKSKYAKLWTKKNDPTDGTTEPIVIRASEYANGGAIQNNNLIPYNPNDLAGVSNNLIRYDGNTHSNGGIPTPSGEFDKQETVLNSKEPYAFSDNLLITKPLAQMQGLPKKYINKTIADASKMVDDKYKIKLNQPTLLQNANRITADNKLNDLVKTNEMLINAEQQLGTQYMCGGKVNKYACGGVMKRFYNGGIPGNPPISLDPNGSQTGDWQNQNIQYNGRAVNQTIAPTNFVNMPSENHLDVPVAGKLPPRYGLENLGQYNESTLNKNPRLNQVATGEQPASKVPMFMRNMYAKGLDAYTDSGMTPLEAASLGTKLASHAYEFASVLKKPDKIQTQYNEFNPQVQRLMREQKVNNQPILNELNLQSNMLFDRNVGNANTQRANNLTVNSQLMDKINQVKMASQTANNQYRTAEANSLNQMGQQNVNARNMQEKLQSETNAARDNAIREAFGNVGNDLADYGLKKDVNNKTITEGFKLLGEDVRFTNIRSIYTTPESYMKALQRPEIKGITGSLDANDTLSEKEIKYLEDNPTELSLVATIRKGQTERLFDLNTGKRRNPVATTTPKERKTEAEITEKEAKTNE